MGLQVALPGLVSSILTWFVVGVLVKKAPQIGLIDRPNERSLHINITPRGGGIGIVGTWGLGCLAWWLFHKTHLVSSANLSVFLLTGLIIAGISLWDDFRSLGVALRLSFQFGCAAVAVATFGYIQSVCLLGVVIQMNLIGIFMSIIWIVGLTNVFNFMDGIDGIAGLQGVVAGLAWCIFGIKFGLIFVGVSGALLAGSCIGFILHNWSPAKIFMGDVGSAFLGYVFGVLPLIALAGLPKNSDSIAIGRVPVFCILVVWPFVADGTFTLCRRLMKFEPIWKPHRSHLYQRMVQAGWSHAAVASYYGFWAALCSIAGLYFMWGCSMVWPCSISATFALVTWGVTVLLERRKACLLAIA